MRITTQGEYAIRCILRIAADGQRGPVSISHIAEMEKLPLEYLQQLLLKLRRRRLIKSVRGSRGGYLLGAPAQTISVSRVLEAAEGEVFELICGRNRKRGVTCKGSQACALRDVWKILKYKIESYLDSVKMEALLKKSMCRPHRTTGR